MVIHAREHGVKPTARLYAASPKTVRKWLKRFDKAGYQALDDLSRRPHSSPRAVSDDRQRKIVALKTVYKRLGADHVKILEDLPESAKTIRKIWRKNGVSSRARRKKHVTKHNLREIKKQFALFERVCEDTKDLDDIPEYWSQMMTKRVPKVQYTFREISSGVQFLDFSDERSLTCSSILNGRILTKRIKAHGNYLKKRFPSSQKTLSCWHRSI